MCQEYCLSYATSGRNFLTNSEKVEILSDYKKELENEAKGVSERIAKLESENE